MKKLLCFFVVTLFLFSADLMYSQISISSNTFSYSQDFDGLVNSGTSSVTPTSWYFSESGTGANTTYSAGTGSSTAGDTYSFGSTGSTERSFGSLLSGSVTPTLGAHWINNSGQTITLLPIKYTGEQWRLGATGRLDKLSFEYSLDATSLITGTWTPVTELDFLAPVTSGTTGALNGNLSINRTVISHTITGLDIPDGASFWIRWVEFNPSGSDDGLGIDDFIFNENNDPLPVELVSFSSSVNNRWPTLFWTTATELNNSRFEIERSVKENQWEKRGTVTGSGTSNQQHTYSFTDEKLNTGVYKYRLKQIDYNGNFEYFNLNQDVTIAKPHNSDLGQNYPNPGNPLTIIPFSIDEDAFVELKIYDALGKEVATLINEEKIAGYYNAQFNATNFASGVYFYKLKTGSFVSMKKMLIIK